MDLSPILFWGGVRKGNSPFVSAMLEREERAGYLLPCILPLIPCGGSLQGSFGIAADKKARLQKNCFLPVCLVLYPDTEMNH